MMQSVTLESLLRYSIVVQISRLLTPGMHKQSVSGDLV